jgi:hypothetical protein
MCVICYLSTDRVIEDVPFNENDPQFNVQRTEERVSHLTKRFVYYCGSSSYCGCQFGYLNITEDMLQRTGQELQTGQLSNATSCLWWDSGEIPPEDKNKFVQRAKSIRESHQDTLALYHMIEETCKEGFDCELLVCWDGEKNEAITQTFQVHIGLEPINVDFAVVRNSVKGVWLYHFST